MGSWDVPAQRVAKRYRISTRPAWQGSVVCWSNLARYALRTHTSFTQRCSPATLYIYTCMQLRPLHRAASVAMSDGQCFMSPSQWEIGLLLFGTRHYESMPFAGRADGIA